MMPNWLLYPPAPSIPTAERPLPDWARLNQELKRKGVTLALLWQEYKEVFPEATREQLSLIFRLACSMIVAKDGGTPLVLDDALGYTDPERLRLMGAALAKAAKECQLIIFTCVPDRYGNVGEASVVSLR